MTASLSPASSLHHKRYDKFSDWLPNLSPTSPLLVSASPLTDRAVTPKSDGVPKPSTPIPITVALAGMTADHVSYQQNHHDLHLVKHLRAQYYHHHQQHRQQQKNHVHVPNAKFTTTSLTTSTATTTSINPLSTVSPTSSCAPHRIRYLRIIVIIMIVTIIIITVIKIIIYAT